MGRVADLQIESPKIVEGSFRHTVLTSARQFKSTWVELGKLLVRVKDEHFYEQWGYETFEAYCLKELHIRRQTAEKLTRSFSFLQRHEPRSMARPEATHEAPAFEVVEVLAQAEQRGQLSAEEYRDVRDSIWNPQVPTPQLRRELLERFPTPAREARSTGEELTRLLGLARKLAAELQRCRKVPRAIAERAAALADDVAEFVEGRGGD